MHTQLRSISATSGFLEECPVEFAPGLTCIIGARGTCKSTLIESIRFAFDCDPGRVAVLAGVEAADHAAPTFGLIKETLRAGSVRCNVIDIGNSIPTTFVLERELDGETRIFVDGVREHANREVLQGIEVFSQGDLQRIAEDENNEMRLELIDRPNRARVIHLKDERRVAAASLRDLGPRIRTARAQIYTLQHEASQLEAYQAQLQRARADCPAPTPELEAERLAYERREKAMEGARQVEALRSLVVERLKEARQPAQSLMETAARLRTESDSELEAASAGIAELEKAVGNLLSAAATVEATAIQPALVSLAQRFEAQSETYFRLRQEQQAVNESLKQQQALQRQVDHLTRQAKDLEQARADEKRLLEERRTQRATIARVDDELYELRIAEIDAINEEHRETVQLALSSGTGGREYSQGVSRMLGGSRIRAQDEVALAIAERFTPAALIDLVEAGQAQTLADTLGRDVGQMNRVVAHLADHPDVHALEAELPSARLEITLYDAGQPKRVETLSKGQRATALLPIILRPLPYPLLFDQPEDDLDNKFVFKSLIKTIQSLKHHRQLIFVTHNANIPVLGGADHVVVMHMSTPSRAAAPKVGTVEVCKQEILDLLEGGAEAFAEREFRYHDLLTPVVKPGPDQPPGSTAAAPSRE
jgi:putative AbiEii toxin of type IV toxin-antitoxin system